MQKEFEALGTKWWITIFDETSTETLEAAFGRLEGFTRAYEAKYSRFKPDSLISTLNRERVLEQPDQDCRALLTYGKSLYLRTNTHFNLLTGHILEARGYNATYTFESHEPEKETPGNPITDLLISEEKIELLHGNVDIGGFGKGYLIDELAKILREEFSLQYFLINGGGDMYASSEQEKPIEIYLEHPTKARHFIHRTTLLNQGFAASSPFKRVWQSHDQTYTHIVTNEAAPRVASFIKAGTARDADAFATTALMLSETELATLSQTENFSVARFTPATNQLWQTNSFNT
ncbi:FAD:protein FMN transferase [Candidatus Nomurabacteria bacterium]|nr:FAD:protein FMN transferase [Candidatus Nomurabacteria bacterium]